LRLGRNYDFWRVSNGTISFTCSVYAEIFEDTLLRSYSFHEESLKDSEGGDVEIL
jgi:hypothetical protein